MDFKHFSHNHPLVLHRVHEHTNCSGCKTPAQGDVYVCWQCRYFLHEQCYRAARSIKHPSHPMHPLTLVPFPTYQSNTYFCNSCSLSGDGFSYSCSECDFDLHVSCASLLTNPPAPQNPVYPPIQSPFPTYPPHA